MRLSLIGMAGSGKSYWSTKLEKEGFQRLCCDDLIEEQLAPEITGSGGSLEMGAWMGFPWEATYESREALYLSKEREILREIVGYLTDPGCGRKDVVVDTTGSVIYAPDELIGRLRQSTIMVYLPVPVEFRSSLLRSYRSHPHPLIWQGMFNRRPGEKNEEALSRCFPKLISSRERLYQRYADVRIDFHQRRRKDFTAADFLALIEKSEAPGGGR